MQSTHACENILPTQITRYMVSPAALNFCSCIKTQDSTLAISSGPKGLYSQYVVTKQCVGARLV